MTDIEALLESGLSEAEAKVYLALLETGESMAGAVIKKAGLHRATTYQVLQRLAEKGLVSSVIKAKKRHFSAAEPQRLMDALRQREERLSEALPRLSGIMRANKEKQDVEVYSGARGIRTTLDAMLSEIGAGGEYLDFGVSGLFVDVMGSYWHAWQRRKKKMGIRSRVIFNEEVKVKKSELLRGYYGRARFHPRENASLTDTMIYRDTVMLIIWTAHPPIAVVVKNAENAKSYRNQFEMMWKAAKK
ncbi:MAG: helix-turn-helix domain-containing protein [Candidatus Micrarchaeota archaeon]|nr:helix-turn-helix domain-containing protein [Candidatus Micrarchaeota archaeon]